MSISPDSSYARCRSLPSSIRETPRQPPPSNGFMYKRVAQLLGKRVQVEGTVVPLGGVGPAHVVDRMLVRHQGRGRHMQPEPDHRAVRAVLLHRLEGERAVEEIRAVDERGLLQPFARVVVPVRESVDHQRRADRVVEPERLDRQPLAGEPVRLTTVLDRSDLARIASKACGQSSSAPRRSPIRWSLTGMNL